MIEGLSSEQIEGILDALPVELIFVDENEKLRYWNKGDKRSRKGPADALGKDIRGCHKPETLPMVEKLVDSLKKGKKDEVEFWVSYNDRILNRFIAVRDKDGSSICSISRTWKSWPKIKKRPTSYFPKRARKHLDDANYKSL